MTSAYNRSVLGATIAERLAELDWTQGTLARKLDVAQQTVSKWVTGETVPRPPMLQRIAYALEVNPNVIIELGMLAAVGGAEMTTPPRPAGEQQVHDDDDPRLAALAGGWNDLSEKDRELIAATFERLRRDRTE